MIKKNKQNVLIMAAGGSGMNVLAQHFLSSESVVYGMDRDFDRGGKVRIGNCLKSLGLRVLKETDCIREIPLDLMITSPAIESNHPVMETAREKKIPVRIRNEYLASIFNEGEGIGISGTSGKTTVTGMVATILNRHQDIYNVFCGDEINNFATPTKMGNYVKGRENKFIAEIDESDKSLPLYNPSVACITSIQKDHMPLEELIPIFEKFIHNSKKVIVNADSPMLSELAGRFKEKTVSVSLKDPSADFYAKPEGTIENRIKYSLNGKKGMLEIAGSYNILNAALAAAVACETGVPLDETVKALTSFKGIRNRFELKKSSGSFFVLDFAHNPEKIQNSLTSAQELGLPVVYIFQPHGYGPLKFMMEEFAGILKAHLRPEDRLVVLKIYDAGGTADRSVHSQDLVNKIGLANVFYMEKHSDVLELFKGLKKEHLTWVVTGARDESLRDLNSQLVHESRL